MRLLTIFTIGLIPFSALDKVESQYLNLDPKPLSVVSKATEIDCLARNIYHEARGESLQGQIAVAAVTVNRVLTKGYPSSICQVVYQPYQFSWVKELLKSKHFQRYLKRDHPLFPCALQQIINGSIVLSFFYYFS